MNPELLGDAIDAYIWDERSAIPGRHPERVPDPEVLKRVEGVIRRLDEIRPDESARDLMGWAERQASVLAADYGGLSPKGVRALRDLLSWSWR
jgi:hypothetical protein